MKKKIHFTFISFSIIAISIWGCRKGSPSWDVAVAAPVIYTTLSISDLLTDSVIQSNPDNSVNLNYSSKLYTLSMDSIWNIPDTTIHESYTTPITTTIAPGQTFLVANSETQYDLLGAELYQLDVREGIIKVEISSTVQEPTQLHYTLSNATLSGVPFQQDIDVPAATTSVPGSVITQFDISGYSLDLRGSTLSSYNMMQSDFTANVNLSASGSVVISSVSDSVNINYSFINFVPNYAKGYFGQQSYAIGPDFSPTSMFDAVISGNIDLDSVRVSLKLSNSVGADAQVVASQLISSNTSTGNTVALSNPVIGSTINLTRAIDGGGYPVPFVHSVAFDIGNSNIDQFIENLPQQVGYELSMNLNPLGNVSGGNDFFYYGNTFDAILNVDIPLRFIASNLILSDTIYFSFTKENDISAIGGDLTVLAENGFPFSASLNMYLLDSNRVLIDSLIGSGYITSGTVDINQVVTAITSSQIIYNIPNNKTESLRNTHFIVLQPEFSTTSSVQHATIYNYYQLSLKIISNFEYHYGPQN